MPCFGTQGYFLETCPKMRYKADFHPSELLCMGTYAWVPLPIALPALKADSHCAIGLVSFCAVCTIAAERSTPCLLKPRHLSLSLSGQNKLPGECMQRWESP